MHEDRWEHEEYVEAALKYVNHYTEERLLEKWSESSSESSCSSSSGGFGEFLSREEMEI